MGDAGRKSRNYKIGPRVVRRQSEHWGGAMPVRRFWSVRVATGAAEQVSPRLSRDKRTHADDLGQRSRPLSRFWRGPAVA